MRPKEVPPSLASDSFRCPRCGALAHQTWFKVYAERFQGDDKPSIIDRKMVEQIKQDEKTPPSVVTMLERMSLKQPILHSTGDRRAYTNLLIENAYLSHCYSCDGITIWVSDNIVDPIHIDEIEPNEDIPPDVLVDFREASSIVSRSPRGAAALLRLAIQKLMPHLELPVRTLTRILGLSLVEAWTFESNRR
jgi:hypothetical protein